MFGSFQCAVIVEIFAAVVVLIALLLEPVRHVLRFRTVPKVLASTAVIVRFGVVHIAARLDLKQYMI